MAESKYGFPIQPPPPKQEPFRSGPNYEDLFPQAYRDYLASIDAYLAAAQSFHNRYGAVLLDIFRDYQHATQFSFGPVRTYHREPKILSFQTRRYEPQRGIFGQPKAPLVVEHLRPFAMRTVGDSYPCVNDFAQYGIEVFPPRGGSSGEVCRAEYRHESTTIDALFGGGIPCKPPNGAPYLQFLYGAKPWADALTPVLSAHQPLKIRSSQFFNQPGREDRPRPS